MNFNAFLELFGLNSEDFENINDSFVDDESNNRIVLIDEKATERICPECGGKCYPHSYYLTKKKFHPNSNYEVCFAINRIQYQCDKCKKTKVFPLKGISDRYKNISINQLMLYSDFQENLTFKEIGEKNGLSTARTIQMFDAYFASVDADELSRIICIDEISCKGYLNSKYACVLMNFETRLPIDIIGSRTKEYLDNYFSRISSDKRAKVKYVISDMFEGYKRVARLYFPNAHYIVDRFHVTQLLSRAVNRIRTKVMNSYLRNEIEYKFMKNHWKLFLSSKYKIPNKFYRSRNGIEIHYDDLLFRCLHLDQRFLIAWGIYQDLLNVPWGKETYKHSEELLNRIINSLVLSNVEELTSVADTFKEFKTAILMGMAKNQLNFKLTNGPIECMNNHIKTIKKDAYGYLNFSRFRKRILLILRNRKRLS